MAKKQFLVNEDIQATEVRVIDSDSSQLGVMKLSAALRHAYNLNLDLIMISPNSTPPVCKIADYGKFRFEQSKKEKAARKNQHITEIKEIRLSLNIDTHDFETKANQAIKFLSTGNKVKVTIRFRGREMGQQDRGKDILQKFSEICSEVSVIEKPAKSEGRQMVIFLSPKSSKNS